MKILFWSTIVASLVFSLTAILTEVIRRTLKSRNNKSRAWYRVDFECDTDDVAGEGYFVAQATDPDDAVEMFARAAKAVHAKAGAECPPFNQCNIRRVYTVPCPKAFKETEE